MPIARKLRSFAALPWAEKWAFFEATICLAAARILVDFFPLSRWRKQIAVSSEQHRAEADLTQRQRQTARLVRRTINRAGRNVPVEFVCLPQAISARWMLRRRGVPCELFIGTRKAAEIEREFHAWLMAGSVMVTGDCDPQDYAVLGSQRTGK